MKRFTHPTLLSAVALSVVLGACSNTRPAPPRPGSIHAQVEQLGEMDYLQVIDMRAVKRNHLLTVQAELNNIDNENQQLYYRFKWLDASGFTVGSDEPWKPLGFYGLQRQTITGMAPSPQAVDFRLVVQSPENSGELPGQ
jgi:uncharacterized protein YcfL